VEAKCSDCGSSKLIPDLPLSVDTVAGGSGAADVFLLTAPQAWFSNMPVYGGLSLTVCGEFGHVDLRAKNFQQLFRHYERTRQS
jgi:hypothetical protein